MELVATTEGIGVVRNDTITLLRSDFADLAEPLRQGMSLEDVGSLPARGEIAYDDSQIVTPLGRTTALWGVGSNYRREGSPIADRSGLPTIFLKPPSSLADPDAALRIPGEMTDQLDYEGEVAIVIGRPTYDVAESEVWSHIAGITSANDATARDAMKATSNPLLGKSFPCIGGIGPTVLTTGALDDREDITIRSWVNGEPRQNSSTRSLVYSIPELVALISRFASLHPGDVVMTGGPAGRGIDSGRFLDAGDVVSVSAAGLRPLVNIVDSASSRYSLQELVKEK